MGVLAPGITTSWRRIGFLLDTGSVVTCVHPTDAMKVLGISADRLADAGQWVDREEVAGVGGTALHYVVPARYVLVHTDGRVVGLNGPLRIAQ